MNKELLEPLKDYIRQVLALKEKMLIDLNVHTKEDILYCYMSYDCDIFQHSAQEVCGDHSYLFHGKKGCLYERKDYKIGWDFGHKDKWVGINTLLFSHFIDYQNYPQADFYDSFKIADKLDEYVVQGILYRIDDLYYFKDETFLGEYKNQ
jgi:hypothetical protein